MFCPRCGTELKEGTAVCPQCGGAVSPAAPSPAAKESSGLAVAALVLSLIARSEQTIVRFQGDERQYDLTVSQADKDGIMDILYGYEYMERNG